MKEAEIFLVDDIAEGVGSYIANQIKYFCDSGYPKIEMHINCTGGRIKEGYSIVSAMDNAKRDNCPIITIVDGFAFSMAGVIAICGDKRIMQDYALLMLHNPFLPNPAQTQKEADQTEKIKNGLVTILANKTGKTKEEISAIMDAETLYSAEEAFEAGFIDEIVTSGQNIEEMQNFFKSALAENKIPILNQYQSTAKKNKILNKKEEEMSKIAGFLNASDEEEALKAVKNLKNDLQKKEVELMGTKTELEKIQNAYTELSQKAETEKKAKVEAIVNDAVSVGKIKAETKQFWLNAATNDFDETKKVLDAMTKATVTNSISSIIAQTAQNGGSQAENKESYEWLWKNNPEKLKEIRNQHPDVFDQMVAQYNENIKNGSK